MTTTVPRSHVTHMNRKDGGSGSARLSTAKRASESSARRRRSGIVARCCSCICAGNPGDPPNSSRAPSRNPWQLWGSHGSSAHARVFGVSVRETQTAVCLWCRHRFDLKIQEFKDCIALNRIILYSFSILHCIVLDQPILFPSSKHFSSSYHIHVFIPFGVDIFSKASWIQILPLKLASGSVTISTMTWKLSMILQNI